MLIKTPMRIKLSFFTIFYILPVLLLLSGCKEDDPVPAKETVLKIRFNHQVNGNNLITDSMIYTNAAGNPYEVTEIMYFISDLKLYHHDGRIIEPATWDDIHYTDTNIPETFEWIVGNNIPEGVYDSLSFTFGISEAKNKSFMFVNPPEVNMAWPEVLGGGYHYMMLNGWWNDTLGIRRSFNFHLGIGQIYTNNSGEVGDITGFVQNAFTVTPDGASFTIEAGKTHHCILIMNVESWFETPVIYDHNHFGGAIMQNQEAMHIGCLNGADAFAIEWE